MFQCFPSWGNRNFLWCFWMPLSANCRIRHSEGGSFLWGHKPWQEDRTCYPYIIKLSSVALDHAVVPQSGSHASSNKLRLKLTKLTLLQRLKKKKSYQKRNSELDDLYFRFPAQLGARSGIAQVRVSWTRGRGWLAALRKRTNLQSLSPGQCWV